MSTQSPHPPTPKNPRNNNNRRTSKKNTTPHLPNTALLNTPPSSPPRNMSPAGAATDSSNNLHSKKKPPRSGKKFNTTRPSPALNNGNRHVSHPNSNISQHKDNAAYAGPTFHASPAPSALPIPSFFSKSFPESDLAPTLEADSDTAEMEPDLETTPSKPRARPQPETGETKATPLDFLFKAAVQARSSNPMGSPEATNRVCSPQTDSKALHNPNATPGGMFAFEMDNSEHPRASPIGPSFATPYQDRMNAYRSANSPSQSSISEEQRQAKTAELKHLLLNPRPQKPPSSIPRAQDSPGFYGPHPGSVPHYATPARNTSGPPGPRQYSQGFSPNQQPMPNGVGRALFPNSYNNGAQQGRNTNSPLRREVPVSNQYSHPGMSSPSRYANQYSAPIPMQQFGYASPPPQYAPVAYPALTNSPTPSKSADTKKMEDDLRRILKLDASPGIQSSFA